MLWVLMYIQRQEKLVMSGSSPTFNIKDYSVGIDFFAPN